MKQIKRKKLDRLYYKLKSVTYMLPITLFILQNKVLASSGSISTAEVNQATENIKNAVIKLAMPIGGILVFVSIVIIALKMIVNSNNANKRSESIGALAWVCGGTMLLRFITDSIWNHIKYSDKWWWSINNRWRRIK